MAVSSQRIDPQRALLRTLERHHASLAAALDPASASTILDRLIHLRLRSDLGSAPDHLTTIRVSAAPWATFTAICADLPLPALANPPAFAELCDELATTAPPPLDLPGRLHERSLTGRKRSGSFYTPTALVRPLIDATLELDHRERSPEQLAHFRVLDLACGAGSFLLAAYEALLAAHERWYLAHPDLARRDGCLLRPDRPPALTLPQRQQILTRSIFGVDLDAPALELAHRALHLRMHAGHPGPHASTPTANLVRLDALTPGALERSFSAVLRTGGFDAILGNPPYVRPHKLAAADKAALRTHYTAFKAKADLYACFMQRAADLLRPGGRLGLVLARGWLALDSFDVLRRHLLDHYTLDRITLLPPRSFPDAQVDTLTLVCTREPAAARRERHAVAVDPPPRTIPQRAFHRTHRNVLDLSIDPGTDALKQRMREGPTLGSLYAIHFGLKTGDDRKFLHRNPRRHRLDRPLLRGEDVHRYGHTWTGEYVRYDPAAMRAHRSTARPGEPARFERPKLLVKDTSKHLGATWEDGTHYVKDVLIILPREPHAPDLKALLAVLNSQAMRFYYRTTFPTLHVQRNELASLPLPRLDLATRSGRALHDRLVALVDQRLAATDPTTTERRIDELVCTLYGLDTAALQTLGEARPAD